MMQVRHGRSSAAAAPALTYSAEPNVVPVSIYPVGQGIGASDGDSRRFDGRNGQITIAQERKTGARLYVEEGVKQSYVLPGGLAGLDYVRLMVRVLEGAPDIVLFGCGGGALASELHNRGSRVTVVDNNPICFEIARRYFWMPSSLLCVADGMTEFLEKGSGDTAAVGSMSVVHLSTIKPHSPPEHALYSGEEPCERRQDCRQHCAQLGSGHYPRAHCGQALQCGPRCGDFRRSSGKGRSALIVATKQATAMNGIAAIASSLGFLRGRGGDRSLSPRPHGSM